MYENSLPMRDEANDKRQGEDTPIRDIGQASSSYWEGIFNSCETREPASVELG